MAAGAPKRFDVGAAGVVVVEGAPNNEGAAGFDAEGAPKSDGAAGVDVAGAAGVDVEAAPNKKGAAGGRNPKTLK